ncbi:MAG: SGNH/GDSL hydrolase family protein [Actinomycetota bacterium]|nr:SGNH/GDSL hydrolase family protein [Actinomycetota bacterium]
MVPFVPARRAVAAAAAAAAMALAMVAATPAAVTARPATVPGLDPTPYYLALGDSLAQGVQPDSTGKSVETNQGYADDLWSRYHAAMPDLRLAKLGCPGETTATMATGGICPYPLGSQLAQATAFLAAHRVVLVTLDIGANNVDGCVHATGLDQACVAAGVASAQHDLPLILKALRQAGPSVAMVAMTYYDPFVAAALKGGAFPALAVQSEQIQAGFNQTLAAAYTAQGFTVADVAGAFAPLNLPSMPYLDLPVDLGIVCAYTWMCAPSPIGPNIHATPLGYLVIAQAFAQKIG